VAEIVWLDNLVNNFLEYLSQNNFIISINERITIFEAIKLINITNREEVFSLFYTIIIKNRAKVDFFRVLFDIFFNHFPEDNFISQSSSIIEEGVLSRYKFNRYEYSSLLNYIVLNQQKNLNRLLHLAISSSNFSNHNSKGEMIKEIKNRVGIDNIEKDIDNFSKNLRKNGVSEERINQIEIDIRKELKSFKKLLRKEANNSIKIKENKNLNLKVVTDNFTYKEIDSSVKKLIEKLKLKNSTKFKNKNSGVINLKKIITYSVRYDMIPFKRFYKKKVPNKTNLIVLSDISDSMKDFSKIMMLFIYALHNNFKSISSFLFISEITEITDLMNHSDINIAISNALNNANIDYNSNSDYNSSFEMFNQNYLLSIKNNSIVIIIGDAKNNYGLPAIDSLIELRKKVKKIIWLNPNSKFSWGVGDSDMLYYSKIIDESFSIQTIEDIENFVLSL